MNDNAPTPTTVSPRELLECLLGHLGFVFQITEIRQGDHLVLNIQTRDARKLIGRDGQVLEEMQYLLNRLLSGKEESNSRVMIDVEGYRQKEQELLLSRVRAVAQKVIQDKTPQLLDEMNAFERYLIHQEFKDHPEIKTRSVETQSKLKQISLEPRKSKS